MKLKNIKSNKASGFTIIELLVVIIVIAILAAITIYQYNGITQRANTTSAKATASAVINKAEIYFTEKNVYPNEYKLLSTSAATTDSFYISGLYQGNAAMTSKPSSNDTKTFTYHPCSYTTGVAPNQVTTYVGLGVVYWDFTTSKPVALSSGIVSTFSNTTATYTDLSVTINGSAQTVTCPLVTT